MHGISDPLTDTTEIERDLAEYGVSGSFWASLNSSIHSNSQLIRLKMKNSRIRTRTLYKLELIDSSLFLTFATGPTAPTAEEFSVGGLLAAVPVVFPVKVEGGVALVCLEGHLDSGVTVRSPRRLRTFAFSLSDLGFSSFDFCNSSRVAVLFPVLDGKRRDGNALLL